MQLGELGDWKSPSVVQALRGNRKAPVGGLGDQVPQKLKRYGEWRGNTRYHVTQITYPVLDLVWAI